jgi:hypothetical protein
VLGGPVSDPVAVATLELLCCECGRRSLGVAAGWEGHLVDLDDDGRDEVVFFCSSCAAREFGGRPDRPAEANVTDADDAR